MAVCGLIIATGGAGIVKAAYSSGSHAVGGGPGNPPVALDRGYNLKAAAKMSVVAVGSDNGILCDGDNLLLYPEENEKEFFGALKDEGVVLFENKADVEKFGKVLFIDGHANSAMVGKSAPVIAKAAGFNIPANTKVIGLKIDAVGRANVLNKEIRPHRGAQELRFLRKRRGNGYPEYGGIRWHRPHGGYFQQRQEAHRVLCRADYPWPACW